MSAVCACCGLAIRKRARFVLSGCHVLHSHCEGISRHMWQHELDNQDKERALRRRIEEYELAAITLRIENTALKARAEAHRDRGDEVERLLVRIRQLEASRAQTSSTPASRQPIMVTTSALIRGGPLSDPHGELQRLALGLAWGRGIWGLARYFTKLVMDRKDDSEARFGLLELT